MKLVTGASGFIGGRLVSNLSEERQAVRKLMRYASGKDGEVVGDLLDLEALGRACEGVETVFHCAGYAHAFSALSNAEARYQWQVNFQGTRNLVKAAGRCGVKRFVFLSSVKAMAEPLDQLVDEDFPGEPNTSYGLSKLAAEQVVLEAGRRYGMHVVNLRLAMVYGSGGRGNLERMGRLVKRGLFPPLPETGNHRSLVHVDDVVSVIRLVATDARANARTYIVANNHAPSGRALYEALRQVQGLASCNWSIPVVLLRLAARLGDGFENIFRCRMPLDSESLNRLLGSAWYSPSRIERELGWKAKVSLLDGLSEMIKT